MVYGSPWHSPGRDSEHSRVGPVMTNTEVPEDFRYISVLQGPYPGYRVSIRVPDTGKFLTKRFCGYLKPLDFYLAEARTWRDETYLTLFGAPTPGVKPRDVPLPMPVLHERSSDTYGIPGVRRIMKTVRARLKSGEIRASRVACVLAEVRLMPGADNAGLKGSLFKSYSINKYGEQEAIRLATRWRAATILRLTRNDDVDICDVQYQFSTLMRQATSRNELKVIAEALPWIPATNPDSPPQLRPIPIVKPPSFDVNHLVNMLVMRLGVSTDKALATLLAVKPPVLSKIRTGKSPVGATLLLRMHEESGLSIRALRDLMGDRRARYYRSVDSRYRRSDESA